MFKLLPIDGHGMKKKLSEISSLLAKSKKVKEKCLKFAVLKVMPTQAAAWFPFVLASSLLMLDLALPRRQGQ
jgi:hypothetical protein